MSGNDDGGDEKEPPEDLFYESEDQKLPVVKNALRKAPASSSSSQSLRPVTRRPLVSAFGNAASSSSDLVARAIRDSSKEEDVDVLPPTLACPLGTRLSVEEDIQNNPTLKFEEDWRNTLLLGALPSVVFLDLQSVSKASIESAIAERCHVSGSDNNKGCGDDDDDDGVVVVVARDPTVKHLSRAALLDVIFRWRRGGGRAVDAPSTSALATLVSCALNPAFQTSDSIDNISKLDSKDKFQTTGVFLKPVYTLTPSLSKLDDTLESGSAPMELVLLRACSLYTQCIHVTAAWPSPGVGAEMSLPRTHTSHLEDEFMRELLMPRCVASNLSMRMTRTLHAADMRADVSSLRSREVKDDACRIRILVKQGRASRSSDPLRDAHTNKFMVYSEFSACVAIADATLREAIAPTKLADVKEIARWVRGTPRTLEQAVVLLERTPLRFERLLEFWRSFPTQPWPESSMVLLAFEAHASLGLHVFKRALHTMSKLLNVSRPWYVCIPYMRRADPLPGYLVVADRAMFMEANAKYGSKGDDQRLVVLAPQYNTPDAEAIHNHWNSISLYNERELRDFCSDWPTLYSDPGEFFLKGACDAISDFATALRKYMCVTDTAVQQRIQRESAFRSPLK